MTSYMKAIKDEETFKSRLKKKLKLDKRVYKSESLQNDYEKKFSYFMFISKYE